MLIGNSSFFFEIANFLLKFKDLIVLIKKEIEVKEFQLKFFSLLAVVLESLLKISDLTSKLKHKHKHI
jgi:hypothetical protein